LGLEGVYDAEADEIEKNHAKAIENRPV